MTDKVTRRQFVRDGALTATARKTATGPGPRHERSRARLCRPLADQPPGRQPPPQHILCNPAITAPIPGLISVEQVDNAALAVMERRELDQAEKAELRRAMRRAWAALRQQYQWLKDWRYV